MVDMVKFFARTRDGKLLGPSLSQSEVDGCNAIIAAMTGASTACIAYCLATAYLETNHSMQPIHELGGNAYFFRMYDHKGNRPAVAAELGNVKDGDGVAFHGRGYVQTTGRANYTKADAELAAAGLIKPGELLANPDLALRPDIAAFIMRRGMEEGWFTTRKLSTYLTSPLGTLQQFTEARRIINGQDRAADIAGYAKQFQDYLS